MESDLQKQLERAACLRLWEQGYTFVANGRPSSLSDPPTTLTATGSG